VRAGLRMLVESRPGWEVVGEASGLEEAERLARSLGPDLVLLDLDLGAESGLDLVPAIRDLPRRGRILVLTGLRDVAALEGAVRSGVAGIVRKTEAAEVLLKAMDRVLEGGVWLDASTLLRVAGGEDLEARARWTTLTGREREVVGLLARGYKNKEIGDALFISETTVRHHLTSVYAKLGVRGKLELVVLAHRRGPVGSGDRIGGGNRR
jgi:DNA-binding NarL/FixJ family response regulator